MNAAQLSQTLLAAWHQRDRSSPWGRRLIAALVLLSTAASLALLQGQARWALPMAILLVVLYGVWMVVGANLQEQNHPTAARCVPGQLRALRGAGLLGWALCTALGTLMLWAMLPPVLTWQTLLLGNAAMATFLLWSFRAWWLWLGMAIYFPLLGAFSKTVQPLLTAALTLWQAQTGGLLALGLLVLAGLVVAAFGRGNASHRKSYERQRLARQAQRLQLEGRLSNPAQAWGGLERFSRPFDVLLSAWRRHVMARADNGSRASVLGRAELVLHGSQHWTYQLLTLVSVVAFVAVSLVLVTTFTAATTADIFNNGAFGMGVGLTSMVINPVLSRPMLWQTRREQALLRLLPAMPQGTALNRAVAWIGLRHALGACLLLAMMMLPLAWVSDKMMMLWWPVMAVPWSIWTATRSPARMQPPTAMKAVLPVFAFYVAGGLAHIAFVKLELPVAALALPVLAASAPWALWRWRRLDAQPTALPAGRLA